MCVCVCVFEQECEKLDRLVELWSEYSGKIGAAADALDPSQGEEAEDQYLELLGSGLYVLQQLALVIGYIWASGDAAVQKRLVFVMHQFVAPPFQSLPFPHPFFALRR